MEEDCKRVQLVTIFKRWMKIVCNDKEKDLSHQIMRTPASFRVHATKPSFMLTDGLYKVQCEFTIESLIEFKKRFPQHKIHDLKGAQIVLLRYSPMAYYLTKGKLILTFHIYEFSLVSHKVDTKPHFGEPQRIMDHSVVMQMIPTVQNVHCYREVLELPASMKKVQFEEGNLASLKRMSFTIALTFQKQMRLPGKFLDVHGFEIVNYEQIDKFELIAEKEAREFPDKDKARKKRMKEELIKRKRVSSEKIQKPSAMSLLGKLKKKTPKRDSSENKTVEGKSSASRKARKSMGFVTEELLLEMMQEVDVLRECSATQTDVGELLNKSKGTNRMLDFRSSPKPNPKAFSQWISKETPAKKYRGKESVGRLQKHSKFD